MFRGGLIEGGAPFTKDVCYLDGLLRVTNFLRIALTGGQSRLARELFAGKLAVEDVPLFDRLRAEGLATEPRYVANWANDLSYPDCPDGLRRLPGRERSRPTSAAVSTTPCDRAERSVERRQKRGGQLGPPLD